MNTLEKLNAGDYNNLRQEWRPDGSVLITLNKRGDPHVYKMVVKNLYKHNEQVLSDEEIPV